MAYKVIKASGSISGLTKREFIVDTAAEITDLPTNKKMGKSRPETQYLMKCVRLEARLLSQKQVMYMNLTQVAHG